MMKGLICFFCGGRVELLLWIEKIADGFHDFENKCFKKHILTLCFCSFCLFVA